MKKWPENKEEIVSFEALVEPLSKLLHKNFKRRSRSLNIPDDFDEFYNIGDRELAICLPVDEDLSKDGIEYHRERDRDLIDIVLGICFRYGIEQGRRMAYPQVKMADLYRDAYLEKIKAEDETRTPKEKAQRDKDIKQAVKDLLALADAKWGEDD